MAVACDWTPAMVGPGEEGMNKPVTAGCHQECESQSDGTGQRNSQQKHRRCRGPEFRISNGSGGTGAARKVRVLRSKSERRPA
jgi:hypothetical protein